jgi:hypothetical protein
VWGALAGWYGRQWGSPLIEEHLRDFANGSHIDGIKRGIMRAIDQSAPWLANQLKAIRTRRLAFRRGDRAYRPRCLPRGSRRMRIDAGVQCA